MRIALQVLSACLLASGLSAGWANGGGGMSMPTPPPMPREQTPQQKAKDAYNDGVHDVKKADKAQAAAAQATDAGKKDKAAHEAQDRYAEALAKFREATGLDATLHEAWNYLGYTNRKLGHYDEALAAYDKALNRIPDAQQAYLDLYAGNRALAGKLLTAMKSWVADQRATAAGSNAANLDELDKWIQERAQIAGQTAALTRAGTAGSWR